VREARRGGDPSAVAASETTVSNASRRAPALPSAARTIIGRVTVAELSGLRAGDEVAGVYACTRKDRLTARTGTPYLALELGDRTGKLPARVFRDADLLGGRFDRGDLVRVKGRVERFRDELQVDVRAIERAAEADPAAFLPVAYRDLDELDGFLEHLAREVHDPEYRALLDALLSDGELRAAWRRAPCTRAGHHAYLGGLLEHTVAVATLALEACQLHPRLNSDLLLCAAIVHDLGKTREFSYGAEIGLTEEGRLLGHVVLGQRILDERSGGMGEARRLALAHCVLTHHGADAAPGRRFGSPEALALYRLNALDASIKGALEHGLP
jgi:3'-5' exoribonuclease